MDSYDMEHTDMTVRFQQLSTILSCSTNHVVIGSAIILASRPLYRYQCCLSTEIQHQLDCLKSEFESYYGVYRCYILTVLKIKLFHIIDHVYQLQKLPYFSSSTRPFPVSYCTVTSPVPSSASTFPLALSPTPPMDPRPGRPP